METETKAYRIRATRSGGLLGYASTWAKSDDTIYETTDKQEAEKLADKWQKSISSHCIARITYAVKEYDGFDW